MRSEHKGRYFVLLSLAEDGEDFRLILLGESFPESPPIFAEAESRLRALGRVGHWGFADSRAK